MIPLVILSSFYFSVAGILFGYTLAVAPRAFDLLDAVGKVKFILTFLFWPVFFLIGWLENG